MSKSTKGKNPDHLTVEEVASILGCGQSEIQIHFHEGTLTKIRASNGEVRVSKAQVERWQHFASILKDWPEPSMKQRRMVEQLVYGQDPVKSGPSEYELAQRRKMQEREEALKKAQKAALAMTACDVCNLQPNEHQYAQRRGIDSHEWTPGRADKLMKKAPRG